MLRNKITNFSEILNSKKPLF